MMNLHVDKVTIQIDINRSSQYLAHEMSNEFTFGFSVHYSLTYFKIIFVDIIL